MKKIDKYIKDMKTIVPTEALVEDTIKKINEMERNKEKQMHGGFEIMNKIKKVIIGLATVLGLATTCCAAYTIITGDYSILERVGIKLRNNYELNSQKINENIETDKLELTLRSIGLTDSFVVAEYNVNTKMELTKDIKLDTKSITFYNQDIEEKVEFNFESNQYLEKNEDGTYTIFGIYYIEDVKNANQQMEGVIDDNEIQNYSGELTSYLFGESLEKGEKKYSRENVKMTIEVLKIETEEGTVIDGSTENNDWLFEFTVNYEENVGKIITNQEQMETFEYEDLEVGINRISVGTYGTYAFITVSEINKEEKSDTIEYVDVIIKDQNGNIISKIYEKEKEYLPSEQDNDYGRTVEFYMFLDANEEVEDYNVEIIKKDNKVREFKEEI